MGIKKVLLQALAVITIITGASAASHCQSAESKKPALLIFHSTSCHSCIKVKQQIIPEVEKKFKDVIVLEYHNVDDIENYTLLLSLQEKNKVALTGSLPVFYIGGHFINGYENIKNGWEGFIDDALKGCTNEKACALPAVNLLTRFKGFTPALIISAGFIDGLNPCAITVIVFFMSFMALQGYKRRELIGIGLSFIFAVFTTYLLIGIGMFEFFYRLKHFWILVKSINYAIGVFSIVLGILAACDLFKFMKTGETEGMILQLPKGIKNKIHKVIGSFGRVVNRSTGVTTDRKSSYGIIVSAFITGFLVTLLEAVCTGQAYLPTISFILKTAPFKLLAIKYLLLYNLMFVMPIMVIFACSVGGVSSSRFSQILKSHLLKIKILMAVSFVGFGIYLIWRA